MSSDTSASADSARSANQDGSYAPSDPQAMRALAHPVRIKLLGLLAHAGTLTATEASEVLGESPANCAFHLRTLAKYGFVEEAGGGRGRERPWRRSHASIEVKASGDPEFAEAATAFSELAFASIWTEAMAAMRAKTSWPEEWLQLPARASTPYLTPAEAAELSSELNALLDRFESRLSQPDQRPPGSVPVEFLLLAWPELDKLRLSPHYQRGESDPPPRRNRSRGPRTRPSPDLPAASPHHPAET